jgi:pimeloyl-ACP methyl ester carboxylesterase
MKKRFSFKLLSVLLAVALLAGPMTGLTAFARLREPVQNYPLIEIPGFMASDIYEDKDDKDSKEIFPWSTDDILNTVKNCIPALLKFLVTKDYDALADTIIPEAKALLEPSFCNPDGTPVGNSGAYMEYPKEEDIHKYSTLTFRYDWRVNPLDVAAELDDFINYVLKATGSKKVAVSCHSLGGLIALTYMSVYGTDKIYAAGLNTTAIFGESYTGRMFSGDITVSGEALVYYLQFALDQSDYDAIVGAVLDALKEAGIADAIAKYANDIIDHIKERAISEILFPMFSSWLSIWAMVPDADLESAKEYMFGVADPATDYSGLREKIDAFSEVFRPTRIQTLEELNEKARVAVISRYGYASIPLTSQWDSLTDGVIDCKNNSFGATTAPYGKQLTDEQLEGVDPALISPDRTVSAHTCLFPEQTWFIKDYPHATNSHALDEMIFKLLFNPEGESTVESYPEYPRFLRFRGFNESLQPDPSTAEKVTGFKAFLQKFLAILNNIYILFLDIFGIRHI